MRSFMKSNARNLTVLLVMVTSVALLAVGQQFAYRVQANIPVEFYVGGQQHSAGDYLFTVSVGDNAVTITNLSNNQSSVLLASPVEYASPGYDMRNHNAVVELNTVGGKYVLAEIEARDLGVSFTPSNAGGNLAESHEKLRIMAALR
jgi:hypothetical protein